MKKLTKVTGVQKSTFVTWEWREQLKLFDYLQEKWDTTGQPFGLHNLYGLVVKSSIGSETVLSFLSYVHAEMPSMDLTMQNPEKAEGAQDISGLCQNLPKQCSATSWYLICISITSLYFEETNAMIFFHLLECIPIADNAILVFGKGNLQCLLFSGMKKKNLACFNKGSEGRERKNVNASSDS